MSPEPLDALAPPLPPVRVYGIVTSLQFVGPGLTVGDPIPKMGLNTSPIGELTFEDCRIPRTNMLGKQGAGFFILEHVMTWEILCIFIMMVGEMQHRMEQCIKYAKRRTQFGKPIGSNQYIEANLASALAAVQIFGGRGYMREAGLEKDLRAAVGAPIYSGTNEMQRVRLASMLGL